MDHSMEQVLAEAEKTVKLPRSAMQVLELTRHEDTPINELTSTIEGDPALAARVLRVANSPAYAKSGGVSDIARAVNWMGFQEISRIAIAIGALAEMSKLQNKLMAISDFQHHSLLTAATCDEIARSVGHGIDSAFTAGLLHDIGLLILFHTSENQMMEVLEEAMFSDDVSVVGAERRILGYDHTQVGAELAKRWELPPTIVASIRHHHDTEWPPQYAHDIAIVAYGNTLTTAACDPSDAPSEPNANLLSLIRATIDVDKLDHAQFLDSARGLVKKMIPPAADEKEAC